jgi:hypothetical protein
MFAVMHLREMIENFRKGYDEHWEHREQGRPRRSLRAVK